MKWLPANAIGNKGAMKLGDQESPANTQLRKMSLMPSIISQKPGWLWCFHAGYGRL